MDVVMKVAVSNAVLLKPEPGKMGAPTAKLDATVEVVNHGTSGVGFSANALQFELFNKSGHKVYTLVDDRTHDPDCRLLPPGESAQCNIPFGLAYEMPEPGEPYRLVCTGNDTTGETIFSFRR